MAPRNDALAYTHDWHYSDKEAEYPRKRRKLSGGIDLFSPAEATDDIAIKRRAYPADDLLPAREIGKLFELAMLSCLETANKQLSKDRLRLQSVVAKRSSGQSEQPAADLLFSALPAIGTSFAVVGLVVVISAIAQGTYSFVVPGVLAVVAFGAIGAVARYTKSLMHDHK